MAEPLHTFDRRGFEALARDHRRLQHQLQDLQKRIRRGGVGGGPVPIYLAKIPADGIPGRTETSGQYFPGSARCEIWRLIGNRIVSIGSDELVLNANSGAVQGPSFRPVWRDGYGDWWQDGAVNAGSTFNAHGIVSGSTSYPGNAGNANNDGGQTTLFESVRHSGGDDIGFTYNAATGEFTQTATAYYTIRWDIRARLFRDSASVDTAPVEIHSYIRSRTPPDPTDSENLTTIGARTFFDPTGMLTGTAQQSINHGCLLGFAAGDVWRLGHDVISNDGNDAIVFVSNGSSITVQRVNT